VWDLARLGLRIGKAPQSAVATTPRPTAFIKNLMADPGTLITRGRTYDNQANLSKDFFDTIIRRYEGTRVGRQELEGELLEDNPGALWHQAEIDQHRVDRAPDLLRIVVGVDPAVSSNADSDETGVVVAGVGRESPPHYYVLDDCSLSATPEVWSRAVVLAYLKHKADRIIGEVNNGGDLVESIIRNVQIDGRAVGQNAAYTAVHATRGKAVRAEPISSLYEQGRVHHVGTFAALEGQLTDWDPGTSSKSPDRLDALVWAMTELSAGSGDDASWGRTIALYPPGGSAFQDRRALGLI
jgi:phage terminase large subunit-like protein